ncbi:kinase-like domain-containing protein [Tribonema minus]|uniref:Kinase-like domain-containing protein n=1 Tax=Tribonema minus TaxID=303371 RepID=A0A836CED4_9STRA|nr:kinase-like domain-containing protein [Tribonema minus]
MGPGSAGASLEQLLVDAPPPSVVQQQESEEEAIPEAAAGKRWDCKFTHEVMWYKDDTGAQCINEYELGEELGRGSFGRVRACKRRGDAQGRQFAMKIMSKPRLRKMAEYVNVGTGMRKVTAEDKVRREIDIMRHLYHRNVVLLFEVLESADTYDDDSHICMVLELMERGPTMVCGADGTFVAERGEAGVWPEAAAQLMFADLVRGMQYLHGRGICHRDIKPDNLMIYENGTLRITDFGCAVYFPPGPARDAALLRDTAGAYTFLAPECINLKADPYCGYGADIWSAGVTLYTWIFGEVPFYSDSPEPLYEAIRNDPVELGEALSADLLDLLARLLDKDPRSRITLQQCLSHAWLKDVPEPPVPAAAAAAAPAMENGGGGGGGGAGAEA